MEELSKFNCELQTVPFNIGWCDEAFRILFILLCKISSAFTKVSFRAKFYAQQNQ